MTDSTSTTNSPLLSALGLRDTWLRIFIYGLFIFSTFTMAGMELAVITLHLLVLYHRLRVPVTEWLPKWVIAPFILYFVLAVISALVNPHTVSGLLELKGEYRLFLPFVMLPALALVDTARLLKVYLWSIVLFSVISIVQFYFNWHPLHPGLTGYFATGGFGMYLTLGGVFLMSAPVFVSLALSTQGKERLLWALGGVAALITVAATTSRSAWIGVTVALLVLLLRLPRRISFPLIGIMLVGIVTLGTLIANGWVQEHLAGRTRFTLIERFARTSLNTEWERPFLWRAAMLGIADAPVFGHSFADEGFDVYREGLARERGITKFTNTNMRPHNQFLRVAFSIGIPGLLVFLWLFGGIFVWNGIWLYRASGLFPFEAALLWGASAALAGSLASGFFQGQFFDAEVQINMLMWMGLSLGLGLSLRRRLSGGGLVAGG